jgi:uncharacterized membrane protein
VIVLAAGVALLSRSRGCRHDQVRVGLLLSTFGTFWAVEGLGWFAPTTPA